MRGLGIHTRHDYVRHLQRFTINSAVSALRFLFDVTLKRRDLSRAW
ncbi:hypothetical protein [Devosia sp. FJ2-5-3]|nr:hypothetical protein [Devosia sp. FJ2-5-3]WEJ56892.1 hypothetical protein N0P34_11765 [Devosia sp. FJ2-5-3]